MASSSHTTTLSSEACPPFSGVRIVALGQSCEVNQKLTLASAERARLEFSSRGAARAALVAPETRSSRNETHTYRWVVPGGGVRA